MKIGVPKEIKTREYRVAVTPDGAAELVEAGHVVLLEQGAGAGAGFEDADYEEVGAQLLSSAEEVFGEAELIVKVKEPQPVEIARLRSDQTLFTYLHLAPDPAQAEGLLASGTTAIAYETITDARGRLPLLEPMSEVAGRMAVQVGAHYLEKAQGGRGILLGGVAGVPPAKVVVIGGGVAGTQAALMAMGLRADVTVFDVSPHRLNELDALYGDRIHTMYSTKRTVQTAVMEADLILGAVLVPGAAAPKLVTRDMVRTMKPGAVLVDIAIDQGGCFETSKPTTHDDPVYVVDGVIHYCVANMPGAVPRTSTFALAKATLPYVKRLATQGVREALRQDPHFAAGLNISGGRVTHPAVARALSAAHARPAWLDG